jgi:hypothetical protein
MKGSQSEKGSRHLPCEPHIVTWQLSIPRLSNGKGLRTKRGSQGSGHWHIAFNDKVDRRALIRKGLR